MCGSRGTKANQSSNDELPPTVLTVFTFTLREYTQYIHSSYLSLWWKMKYFMRCSEAQISHLNEGENTKKRPSSAQKTGTRKHPWGDRYRPGAGLHRCHQSGRWLARICSLVSQRAAGDKRQK